LTGQLDSTKSWDVTFIFNGEEKVRMFVWFETNNDSKLLIIHHIYHNKKVLKVREDTSILESVEKVFDGVESSCRNGVCTTCAGKVSMYIFC
jgi:ferredoxin